MLFLPAHLNLVANTKVHRQIWSKFYVILNEHLRTLLASANKRLIGSSPALCVPQKEICPASPAPCGIQRRLGVLSGEIKVTCIDISPSGGIVFQHNEFTAEMQDMLAEDEG